MLKHHFPIFKNAPRDGNRGSPGRVSDISENPLIYLDSAATTQKPQSVIDAISQYYETTNANVHRGIYHLSEKATALFESVRVKVKNFIHAKHLHEIIFTKGTTDAINLVAQSFGSFLKANDEIILSVMEHHSNIVPWQQLCERVGCRLKIIPLNALGEIDFEHYKNAFNEKTKLVTVTHVSNVLGTINPVKEMIAFAHQHNVPVVLDGAQAIAHLPVDVQDLDCDFYVFSSHKLYGPTGVGVLYGKTAYLEKMPPYQTGGDMIAHVTFEKTTFNVLPYKFEAGTPNIAGVVGLGAAIDFVNSIGFDQIQSHEKKLLISATKALQDIEGLKIVGSSLHKTGVISFTLDTAHPHDVATILNESHISIRAGHHCAMPLMQYLNVPALSRISFGIYNEESDVRALVEGLEEVMKVFEVK